MVCTNEWMIENITQTKWKSYWTFMVTFRYKISPTRRTDIFFETHGSFLWYGKLILSTNVFNNFIYYLHIGADFCLYLTGVVPTRELKKRSPPLSIYCVFNFFNLFLMLTIFRFFFIFFLFSIVFWTIIICIKTEHTPRTIMCRRAWLYRSVCCVQCRTGPVGISAFANGANGQAVEINQPS